ncbi:bifunctional diguanylate cyclase/phosphodiesterase [Methyloversatilis thermotolerans]|uniref:bifunctional diguanylate cyclase/phosphodiesterase n=1 Tax=Methyloversatilis thermotolerans TaxID=1346290 RepID=UPI0003676F7D|nr:bifunctional diguanylate cyclase/phosphodiesterase [Methyloversatilis thermotolerans]
MDAHDIDAAMTRVLIIHADAQDAGRLRNALEAEQAHVMTGRPYLVECVTTLADARTRLAEGGVAVVLLDLAFPFFDALDTCEQIRVLAPEALVLVLVESGAEAQAREALRRGAHDFLLRGRTDAHCDAHWLARAVDHAMQRRAAAQALRISEARFRAISSACPLGILVTDPQGKCTYTNAAFLSISGFDSGQTAGVHWSHFIHPDDRVRVQRAWAAARRMGVPFGEDMRLLHDDGSVVWTRLHASFMMDGGVLQGCVQTVEDITGRKAAEAVLQRAEEALFDEKERAQVTLNSIGDAVLATDLSGRVSYLNRMAESMTGWTAIDALGKPLTEVFYVIDGTTRAVAVNPAQRAVAEDRTVSLAMDCLLVRRDGVELPIEDSAAPIHDRQGKVTGAVIVFHDVSQSRAVTMRMAHMAQHDFLTGLPNRALLTERLAQAIGQAARHHKQVALLFIDLDHFKRINDSLGHALGDQVLQHVAGRLVGCVRTTDSVCRQGGDEFVILLAEIERPQDAAGVAEKVLQAFSEPQQIAGHALCVTLSVGISVYPDDGATADAMMRNADTAMYHAKAQGRDRCQFFTPGMNANAVHRTRVEASLRRAFFEHDLFLHYQPQMSLVSGSMVGVEALLRWRNPEQGLTHPSQFMQIAEECGLSIPIGQWVIREACGQLRTWQDLGLDVVPVSVNVSVLELWHPDFANSVALILRETGVAAHLLGIEVAESRLMQNADLSSLAMKSLKCLGVKVVLDDFGGGFSSLGLLSRVPFDALKISQSFTRDLDSDPGDGGVVGALIGMAAHLRTQVIAPGVESERQLALLRVLGCDVGQGHLLGRPAGPDSIVALLSGAVPVRPGDAAASGGSRLPQQ